MKSKPSNTRKILLISTLAASLGAWAYKQAEQTRLEASIVPQLQAHTIENQSPDVEVASRTTVARKNVLWGVPRATVEVYIRAKDGGEDARITGIEYHYERDGDQWRLTDSGACSGDECALRGHEAFRRQSSDNIRVETMGK